MFRVNFGHWCWLEFLRMDWMKRAGVLICSSFLSEWMYFGFPDSVWAFMNGYSLRYRPLL